VMMCGRLPPRRLPVHRRTPSPSAATVTADSDSESAAAAEFVGETADAGLG
jgi:hypothetical protein